MITYDNISKKHGSIHHNKCIDGSITGQSCCVGYCNYREHKGFLTKELRKQHNCINKCCYYYVPKPKAVKKTEYQNDTDSIVESKIKKRFSSFEGMKIIKMIQKSRDEWIIDYITISNDYPIYEISKEMETEMGCFFIWNNLNYDYETAAKIILC